MVDGQQLVRAPLAQVPHAVTAGTRSGGGEGARWSSDINEVVVPGIQAPRFYDCEIAGPKRRYRRTPGACEYKYQSKFDV